MSRSSQESFGGPVYNPFPGSIHNRPAIVRQRNSNTRQPFLQKPFFGALLFPNESSDCRDHCANERTFLSWLRLSIYLAIVSVAIVISFHLKHRPTKLERQVSLPLGCVFFVLSLACLLIGLANYIQTVSRYSRRQALVQSGWKTQAVFGIIAVAIIASCILFLSVDVRNHSA